MYRAGIEGLLGMTRAGPDIILKPCFPKAWPEVKVVVRTGESRVSITIDNSARTGHGIVSARLDGEALQPENGQIVLRPSAPSHSLSVRLG